MQQLAAPIQARPERAITTGGAIFGNAAALAGDHGIEHLEQLPGIRWKLRTLEQLARANPRKLKAQAQELERLLGKTV